MPVNMSDDDCVTDQFSSSHLKIEWAKKHINNLNSLLAGFANSDFYELTVEKT
jgi:hypothetical protein